jgi:dolichyl-phosphate-mannose-protein mannosyltransferase
MVNAGMYYSNNALTPDPEKEPDVLTSQPWEWPILRRGLRMVGWGDSSMKFYLIGNPVVWWGGYASIILILCATVYYFLRRKRACQDFQSKGKYL